MLVPREHEMHPCPLQTFDRVPCVVHDVALATGAGHRQQMMVEHEDLEPALGRELLLDPAIASTADLTVVEVGLGRVDRDDRDRPLAQHRFRPPNSASKCTYPTLRES